MWMDRLARGIWQWRREASQSRALPPYKDEALNHLDDEWWWDGSRWRELCGERDVLYGVEPWWNVDAVDVGLKKGLEST
jgi:hypothetical protein